MTVRKRRVRSGPIFVETERGTISLVFEADVRNGEDGVPRPVGKPDVYVIDGDGVRLIRHGSRLMHVLIVGIVAYLILVAVYRLLRDTKNS